MVDTIHDTVATRLDRAGQQYTPNRRALIDALANGGRPMTLPDLLAADPSLAQSSAYRNLGVLVEAGVVTRLVHGGDHAFFELAEGIVDHHHHLVCERCGSVTDIVLPGEVEAEMDRCLEAAAEAEGFAAARHVVDLYGTCFDCR